jgi:hypothetical protein
MEQQYVLKKHGNYSIFEQHYMTAEERAWVIERIKKDNTSTSKTNTAPRGRAMPPVSR